MASQLAWIGLGNMGRVMCALHGTLLITNHGIGHVQEHC